MTDYTDGQWHIWQGKNGDQCPVDPESRIDIQYWQGPGYKGERAGFFDFQDTLMFRVTKAVKP